MCIRDRGAPTLVFLHGTRVTRAMWGPQVAALADRYRVVIVDLPGHGVLADMPFRIPGAVAVVRSVIERTGGCAIVIGQSLGGYVAMELAAAHPGHVAGLILCNAATEPRTVARRAPRAVGVYLVDRVGERYLGRGAPVQVGGPNAGPAPRATNGWLFKGGYRAAVTALRTSFLPRLAAYPGPVDQEHRARVRGQPGQERGPERRHRRPIAALEQPAVGGARGRPGVGPSDLHGSAAPEVSLADPVHEVDADGARGAARNGSGLSGRVAQDEPRHVSGVGGGQLHGNVPAERLADHDRAAAGPLDDGPHDGDRARDPERHVGENTVAGQVHDDDAVAVGQGGDLWSPHGARDARPVPVS